MKCLVAMALALALASPGVWAQGVVDLAEQAAIASLCGDAETLGAIRKNLNHFDEQRDRGGESPSGLIDNVMALEALAMRDRGPMLGERLLNASSQSGTAAERRRYERMAEGQNWPTIKRLRWENSFNRVAGVFNSLIERSFLFLVGPTEAILQLGVDVIFSYRVFLYPTPVENKIVVKVDHLVQAAPDVPEIGDALELQSRIMVKQERAKRRDLDRRVRLAGQLEEWELMLALAESGLILWPDDERLRAHRLEADHQIGLEIRGWMRSLLVLPTIESGFGEEDWTTLGDGIREVLSGNGVHVLEQWNGAAFHSDEVRTECALLIASTLGRMGSEEMAESLLRDEEHWLVSSFLEDPEIDLTRGLRDAEERRDELTSRFVWTGARGLDENLHMASSSAVTKGLEAPISLGFFYIVDATVRRIAVAFRNPFGADLVLDELRTLERREGTLPKNLLERRRDLLIEIGEYERAIETQRMIDPTDEGRLHGLHAQWGDSLMTLAGRSPNPEQRRRMFSEIVERCPDTRAANRAWRELQSTPWPGVNLTLEEIRGNGLHLATMGFTVPIHLWDGDRDNGEIDRRGVWLDDEGTIHWRLHRSRQWESALVPDEDRGRVSGAFEYVATRRVVDDLLLERMRPRVPIAISGGVGSSGIHAVPQLQQFRHIDEDLPLYR